MRRSAAREQAFILIFEQSFSHDDMEQIFDTAEAIMEKPLDAFASRMALGAKAHAEEINEIIEKNIQGWKMNRLSRVSLAVLRLAVYELLWEPEVPVKVSINEAIELAKKYGGADDGPFVNGVLGSVAKGLPENAKQKGTGAEEAAEVESAE